MRDVGQVPAGPLWVWGISGGNRWGSPAEGTLEPWSHVSGMCAGLRPGDQGTWFVFCLLSKGA